MPKGKILMGKAPGKKEMNRTAGTARRLTGRSEGIATKLKYGAPLTGSASGVKSISLKDAGEALTQGIVTLGKKGLKFAPEGLAMALPVGKVAKAAKALRAVGGARNRSVASALTERLRSKAAGKSFGQSLAENKAAGGGPILQYLVGAGTASRRAAEKVFPRAKFGENPIKATEEMQSVANKISQRHYADVAKKGLGHAEAVDMNRAKVLRNLASKRGVDLGVAKASVKRRGK